MAVAWTASMGPAPGFRAGERRERRIRSAQGGPHAGGRSHRRSGSSEGIRIRKPLVVGKKGARASLVLRFGISATFGRTTQRHKGAKTQRKAGDPRFL